jgi:hypothetical protein
VSIPTSSLVFEDFACVAQKTSKLLKVREGLITNSKPTLRLALLHREELVFPKKSKWIIKILSGKAWVSFNGKDILVGKNENLIIPKDENGAIISAVGKDALFFEVSKEEIDQFN